MYEVSILIPFYNPGKKLTRAVASVFEQIDENWQLILIDDASTDDSVSDINEYLADPRVLYVKNPQNAGVAFSLNQGLKHVTAPFVIRLDSDDFFYPHTLKILLEAAKTVPEDAAMICGNAAVIFETGEGVRWFTSVHKGKPFTGRYELAAANLSLLPCFLRTTALIDIGGWPGENSANGRMLEDRELLLKLIEKYQIHWIDQMLYHVCRHEENLINETSKESYQRVFEEIITHALQRWGGEYQPIFSYNEGGWRIVKKLIQTT